MTDKNKGNPTAEDGSNGKADPTKNGSNDGAKPKEGDETVPKSQFTDQQKRATKAEEDLKTANSTIDDLKKQLEGKADGDGKVSDVDVEAIAEKHGVDPAFAKDLADGLLSSLSKEVKATEEKLEGEFTKRDEEQNKIKLDNAFKAALDAVTEEYDEETTIDHDAVKDLYFARKESNPDLTVADVVESLYGAANGASSSEDEGGSGDEQNAGETVDFETLSKDPEKLAKVIKNPKHKSDYYAWRDKKGI